MRAAGCSRFCRATTLCPNQKVLRPNHHRSIATATQDAPEPSISKPRRFAPTSTINRKEMSDEIATSGPRGSPDYIHRKRGYAPNIPIPARKFNLPTVKPTKGAPDPKKTAPEPREERLVKNYGIEYERQLNAMRRGYVHWRSETFKEKVKRRQEIAKRPKPPPPAPFVPSFAERMATASNTDQVSLEQQLFGTKVPRKERGAGYYSEHHQRLISRKRYSLINDYLSLYHASKNFITTPEELEELITYHLDDRQLQLAFSTLPQSYESLMREMEEGPITDFSYVARSTSDRMSDIVNAMTGTVEKGKPGYEEVMKEIQESFDEEAETEAAAAEAQAALQSSQAAAQAEKQAALQSELDTPTNVTAEAEATLQVDEATTNEVAERSEAENTNVEKIVESTTLIDNNHLTAIKADETPSAEASSSARQPFTINQNTPPRGPTWFAAEAASADQRLAEKKARDLEQLRQKYRDGFVSRKAQPTFYDVPTRIQNAPAGPQEPESISIVDQAAAAQLSKNPKFREKEMILETAKRIALETGRSVLFPELGSVAVEEPDKFDYVIQREEFERQFPSRIAKQATDTAAWDSPTKQNKYFTQTKPKASKPVGRGTSEAEDIEESAPVEESEKAPAPDAAEEPFKLEFESPFEVKLDEAQRQELEKIRERRERLRGGALK